MGWSDDAPSCWEVYCMFGEFPALMLVSWITGGRWWWKKQERRMGGTVKSAQRMTGVFFRRVFRWVVCVFLGEKHQEVSFLGAWTKIWFWKSHARHKSDQKKVSEILVWGTFLVLFFVLMVVFVSMFWILLVLCVCILQSEWQDSFCLKKGRLLNQPALVDMS